jgi:DNA repair protein RadC
MAKNENLHAGHRKRMRASFRKQGLPSEPHRQLELLLFWALPRTDTNKTAHRLINRFGSVKDVLNADFSALEETEGVGEGAALFLKAVGDIAREYSSPPPSKPGLALDTEDEAEGYIKKRLVGEVCECILIVYLDAKRRLIEECLTKDTSLSSARVENSLRLTVKTAVQSRAAFVIAGHNHPKGNPMPSQRDMSEAVRLRDALRFVGVGLSDFIIVGEDGETYSLLRGGLLI